MIRDNLNDKWAKVIVIPIIALIFGLTGVDFYRTNVMTLFFNVSISLIYITMYWELNRLLFVHIVNKHPKSTDRKKRLFIKLGFIIGFILCAGIILDLINYAIPGLNSHFSFLESYTKIVEKSLFSLGIIMVLLEIIYFFGLYESSRFENQRLNQEALMAQLILLRQQISPHFLFNNLNTLITLIPKDPGLSVQYVQKLATVYRQVLEVNEKEVVSLESELSFLQDYIFLYQIRFGDKLKINYNISQDIVGLKVLPMALQMLVENAIKHNIISSDHKLFIQIIASEQQLTVSNNLQKKTSGVISSNTGLLNIQSRYKLLTNIPVKIETTGNIFSVSIPILI